MAAELERDLNSNKDLQKRASKAMSRGVGIAFDIYAKEALNSTITDVEGKEYIDFAGGIAVLNTGHRHPKIMNAVKEQLDRFTHTCIQVVPYEGYIKVCENLNELAPIENAKSALFTTGAEAVENAVKIAKHYTKRHGVISFTHSFHGRTLMGLALTGKVTPYKDGFGVMPSGIFHALFPSRLENISVEDSLKSIYRIFTSDISPNDVAAIIFEPVQGEGGFNPASNEFVVELRKICDKYGILLIADEIQTGIARTGKMFAVEHFNVKVDLIATAKSLAGGFPLSGVVGRAEIMDSPGVGGLGGTYAGNPLATAASNAVFEIIKEENLCEKAEFLGAKLETHLNSLNSQHIKEIRRLGSMVAIEIYENGKPSNVLAKKIQTKAKENQLLLLLCGHNANVIRFLYPLTIDEVLFNKALEILKKIL